ncbi:cilium assembly protein DZIP1L-like [Mytilus trossulus]|uniref:cilium assembly protein DZIP1L-like n=1 Tax=Mytilus trossulus TaxID=6551 RepID=UPI003005CCE1
MATQMMYSPMPDHSVSYMNGYPNNNASKMGNGKSFAFRKRYERVDWRKISSVDLDHISRTLDFNALQENILNITFCNIESEMDLRMIDPNFVKLFKLAQLTIEYLLHSQEYLTGVVGSAEEKIKAAQEESTKTKEELEKQKKELADVKKESHKRKKLLIAQQHLIHAGSGSYNKCQYCSKAFLNSTFLQSHIMRRHGEYSGKAASVAVTPNDRQIMAESPGLRDLQQRLEATEAQLQQERMSKSEVVRKSETTLTRNVISTDLNRTEEHKEQLERMKGQFMTEIRELNERLHAAELAKDQFDHRQSNRSFLGELTDDNDIERENLRDQREQLAMLKEQLQDKIQVMEGKVHRKFGKKEKNYQKTIQELNRQHADDLRKLNDALQKTTHALAVSKAPLNKRQHEENEALLRSSREIEIKLRHSAEAETIEEMIAAEQATMGASTKVTQMHMEPSDDEDEETEPGTLNSGTGTGSYGTGRQSMISTMGTYRSGEITLKTQQFLEELRKNPTLKIMRDELEQLLQEQLEKIGVPPETRGLPVDILRNKLQILRGRRQTTQQKYPVFSDFRRQYDAAAEEQAREKLKQMKRSPPPAPRSHMPPRPNPSASLPRSQPSGGTASMFLASPARTPGTSPQRPGPGTSPQRQPISSQQRTPQPVQSQQLPKAAPRVASPQRTGQSGSSIDWTSTQWESDDDDDESENQPAFQQVRHVPSSPARQPQQHTQPVAAPRSQVIMSKPLANDGDDDWDDSEDMSELGPKASTAPVRRTPQQQSYGMSTSPAQGQKVAELSRTIEHQLAGRKDNQKRAGAVDIMGLGSPSKSSKQPDVLDDFSDSDWDVSPVEDESPQKKQQPVKKPASSVRGSHATDTSNTYGTSVWGSSSKGGSTVPPAGSKERTSFVSVTDVSSDEELMRDIENI